MTQVASLLATGFGIGRVPFAPGTAAALATLPIGWVIALAGGWQGVAAASLLVAVIGIWACGAHAHATGNKDPGECVADEVAGQLVAMIPLAPSVRLSDLGALFLAFLFFRFFDIAKPWPIARLERLGGGLGIMADDILAGAISAALLAATLRWM